MTFNGTKPLPYLARDGASVVVAADVGVVINVSQFIPVILGGSGGEGGCAGRDLLTH